MNADALLILLFGVMLGFSLGYVTAWRFARRLEWCDVKLSKWDQPWDAHTPAMPKQSGIFPIDRQS